MAYCKNNYACNSCNQKGHFAKDCPIGNTNQNNQKADKSGDSENKQSKRRAFITVGLSTANVNQINSKKESSDLWYQDCAATQHMTYCKDWITDFIEFEEPTMVMIGDATELKGIGMGDVKLEAFNGKECYKIILKNVLCAPKMTLLDKGYVQTANANKSIFKTLDGEETVAMVERDGNLYHLIFRREMSDKCMLTMPIKIWHERLAH